jgi:SAM-dependent methyltransferase
MTDDHTVDPQRKIKSASHAKTNEVIERLLLARISPDSRVVDFGAGRGHMSARLADYFRAAGRVPRQHIKGFEVATEQFECDEVDCIPLVPDAPIPEPPSSADVIYAIEVLEHCPRPYELFRDFARVLRPGGHLIFSVPNLLTLTSRVRFLLTGYSTLYGPPSIHDRDAGRIAGHIMPLSLPYFVCGLLRAGFSAIQFHSDRKKRSALCLSVALMPLLRIGTAWARGQSRRYDERLHEETGWLIDRVNQLDVLTSRSCIITCHKAGV